MKKSHFIFSKVDMGKVRLWLWSLVYNLCLKSVIDDFVSSVIGILIVLDSYEHDKESLWPVVKMNIQARFFTPILVIGTPKQGILYILLRPVLVTLTIMHLSLISEDSGGGKTILRRCVCFLIYLKESRFFGRIARWSDE